MHHWIQKKAVRIVSCGVLVCALALVVTVGCGAKKEKTSCFSPIKEVPFDESMGKSETEFRFIFANSDDAARYTKFKALYEKNLPSKVSSPTSPRIPKILHQIWLGPKMPPDYAEDFKLKWKSIHPDWEYRLWSEADLEPLNLDNWDIVEKSQNWAEKSDIIRCDLLDKFGGVYLDCDMDPLHSLDELHEKYDFYAGLEHPHKIATTTNRVWVGISIMASRPGHPIMKNWKKRIRAGWDEVDLRYSNSIERVINHTYFPFTHSVLQEIDQPGNVDILLPATYFYPIAPNYAAKRRSGVRAIRENLYEFLESINLKRSRPFSRPYDETIAVHYWGNTWLPDGDAQTKEYKKLVDDARKELYKVQQKLRAIDRQMALDNKKLSEIATLVEYKKDQNGQSEMVATAADEAMPKTGTEN